MIQRLWKSVFLIVGTAIGAGILALPITTADHGFWGSFFALFVAWAFMTNTAYYMLKTRLCFKGEADLTTMTQTMLGSIGRYATEISYFLLLYALVSVYIIVGAAWLDRFLDATVGHQIPPAFMQILFAMGIFLIIYSGIARLSSVNYVVTCIMLLSLGFIIFLCLPTIKLHNLVFIEPQKSILNTLPMILTTLGFSIIFPSIATYMESNKKKLLKALSFGSIIILTTYVLWQLIAFGVIGLGAEGLGKFKDTNDVGTEVIQALGYSAAGFSFMFFATLSSLLGVGQCLYHYLMDTLPIRQKQARSLVSMFLWIVIPLLIVNLYPMGISKILGFGGIFVAIILGIIPSLMILSKEYALRVKSAPSLRQKIIAYASILFFTFIIFIEIFSHTISQK